MKAGAVWAIAVGVGTALLVAGCGEKPQTATQRKVERAGLVAGEPFGGPEYPLVDVDR